LVSLVSLKVLVTLQEFASGQKKVRISSSIEGRNIADLGVDFGTCTGRDRFLTFELAFFLLKNGHF
jgi:hypothetical protein